LSLVQNLVLQNDVLFSGGTIGYAHVQAVTAIAAGSSGIFTLANYLTFDAPGGPSAIAFSDGTPVNGVQTTQIAGTTPGTNTATFATLAFANRTYATVNSASAADVLTVNIAQAAVELGGLTVSNTLTCNTKMPIGGILIGGNGHDLLTAGLGRSILVAKGGTSTLIGGGADDILIGGYTNYDHRQSALQAVNTAAWLAILAEGQRTDRSYGQRLHDLRDGGGLNGTAVLVWGVHGAVHDNGAADVLQGGPSGTPGHLDWFFRGRHDVFAVLPERGEHINNG
jgi:hypothetical protein